MRIRVPLRRSLDKNQSTATPLAAAGTAGRVLRGSGNAQAPFSAASAPTGIVRAGVVRG